VLQVFLRDILSGLAALHDFGICLAFLSSKCVLVDEEGCAKIAHLGWARRFLSQDASELDRRAPWLDDISTMGYMAPELLDPIDPFPPSVASDLWAVGCVMFELLSGEPPFGGDDAGEALSARIRTQPADIRLLMSAPPLSKRPVDTPRLSRLSTPIVSDGPLPTEASPARASAASSSAEEPPRAASQPFAPSPEALDLLSLLLDKDPRSRMGWAALVSHPFWGGSPPVPPGKRHEEKLFHSCCTTIPPAARVPALSDTGTRPVERHITPRGTPSVPTAFLPTPESQILPSGRPATGRYRTHLGAAVPLDPFDLGRLVASPPANEDTARDAYLPLSVAPPWSTESVSNSAMEALVSGWKEARIPPLHAVELAQPPNDVSATLDHIQRLLAAPADRVGGTTKCAVLRYCSWLCQAPLFPSSDEEEALAAAASTVCDAMCASPLLDLWSRLARKPASSEVRGLAAASIALAMRGAMNLPRGCVSLRVLERLREASSLDVSARVRRTATAALGETLFYLATQGDEASADGERASLLPSWWVDWLVDSLDWRASSSSGRDGYTCKVIQSLIAVRFASNVLLQSQAAASALASHTGFCDRLVTLCRDPPPSVGQDERRRVASVSLSALCGCLSEHTVAADALQVAFDVHGSELWASIISLLEWSRPNDHGVLSSRTVGMSTIPLLSGNAAERDSSSVECRAATLTFLQFLVPAMFARETPLGRTARKALCDLDGEAFRFVHELLVLAGLRHRPPKAGRAVLDGTAAAIDLDHLSDDGASVDSSSDTVHRPVALDPDERASSLSMVALAVDTLAPDVGLALLTKLSALRTGQFLDSLVRRAREARHLHEERASSLDRVLTSASAVASALMHCFQEATRGAADDCTASARAFHRGALVEWETSEGQAEACAEGASLLSSSSLLREQFGAIALPLCTRAVSLATLLVHVTDVSPLPHKDAPLSIALQWCTISMDSVAQLLGTESAPVSVLRPLLGPLCSLLAAMCGALFWPGNLDWKPAWLTSIEHPLERIAAKRIEHATSVAVLLRDLVQAAPTVGAPALNTLASALGPTLAAALQTSAPTDSKDGWSAVVVPPSFARAVLQLGSIIVARASTHRELALQVFESDRFIPAVTALTVQSPHLVNPLGQFAVRLLLELEQFVELDRLVQNEALVVRTCAVVSLSALHERLITARVALFARFDHSEAAPLDAKEPSGEVERWLFHAIGMHNWLGSHASEGRALWRSLVLLSRTIESLQRVEGLETPGSLLSDDDALAGDPIASLMALVPSLASLCRVSDRSMTPGSSFLRAILAAHCIERISALAHAAQAAPLMTRWGLTSAGLVATALLSNNGTSRGIVAWGASGGFDSLAEWADAVHPHARTLSTRPQVVDLVEASVQESPIGYLVDTLVHALGGVADSDLEGELILCRCLVQSCATWLRVIKDPVPGVRKSSLRRVLVAAQSTAVDVGDLLPLLST
jgi:serine/threonine protein kinase